MAALNMRRLRQTALMLAVVFPLAFFQNCAETVFSGVETNNSQGDPDEVGPSCREELQNLTVPTKLLFVVDVSGSNFSNGPGGGTDPNKTVRQGSIQAFFNTYQAKLNFSWGFNVFNNNDSRALIGAGGAQNPPISGSGSFSNTASVMQSAITNFGSLPDTGSTPYLPALQLARNMISADPDLAVNNTKYIVVFISDGLPNPSVSDDVLSATVQDIVSLASNRVSVNTIYYGPANIQASQRLLLMAQAGGGYFLNTNVNPAGLSFAISDVISIPGVICQ